jgi:hypothetical protein
MNPPEGVFFIQAEQMDALERRAVWHPSVRQDINAPHGRIIAPHSRPVNAASRFFQNRNRPFFIRTIHLPDLR